MNPERFLDGRIALWAGDCREVLARLPENYFDSCVCDPPYHLQSIVKRFAKTGRMDKTRTTSGPHQRTAAGFMNQTWDGGDVAFDPETWAAVLRVLKPGAFLLAFGGTRTYHRMACAIEDGGFVIYDCVQWLFGQGFPKNHNISKAIDRAAGVEREVLASHGRGIGTNKTRVELGYRPNEVKIGSYTAPATDEAAQWEGFGTALKPAC